MEDYHSMKRKELQALCKKHNIPANSANSVLADKLSQLLNVQEKQKPITGKRACLKSQVETTDESEPEVSKKEAKKVRFSPTSDLVEYEPESVKKQQAVVRETRARKKSVAIKMKKPVVDNDNNRVEIVDDAVQIPVKLTRSRVHILEKDDVIPNVGKRQGRSAVKDVAKGKDLNEEVKATRPKVHGLGKCGAVQPDEKASESVEEPVVVRARVTRSKAQTSMDPDVKPQVKKTSGRQVAKAAQLAEPAKEVVDVSVRTTRTRGQPPKEDIRNTVTKPQAEKKRTRREMKATDQSSISSNFDLEDNQELPKRKPSRTRQVKFDDEHEGEKVQMIDNRRVTQSRVSRSSKSKTENKAEAQRKSKRVQHFEEPLELVGNKNVKRRESAIQPVQMEAVLHLEEPVNVPTGRATRGKSIMQAQGKGIDPDKTEAILHVQEPVSPPAGRSTGQKSLTQKGQTKATDKPSDGKREPAKETEIAPTGRTTRRKSIMQNVQGKGIDPEKTEVVLDLEEPVSSPAGRSTRRKSLMQKGQSKATDKPSDGKSEPVKEMEIPDSHKAAGRNQSKRQSSSLSMIDEGLKDNENIIRSGTDAYEDKMKAVAKSTISSKSKKRRGSPIIEDVPVEVQYVSPVESSRRSTRSASKSEGKVVTHPLQNSAKNQLKSGLKTSSPGGAVVRDGSSKKRAKLSVMKQSESEDHGEKSKIERTPITKLVTFELGERVIENEQTPAIDGSHRRFTRSAIGSNRKEPSQSAIKDQPIGEVQFSSHKAPNIRQDSAVKTAPGRITRSGIKHAGNLARGLSERVDKKKQQRETTQQGKAFDDLHMFSNEVAESSLIPDATIGAESQTPKELTDQILEHAGDISASESVRLPAEVAKESKSETAITMESLSSLFDEEASGVELPTNFEVDTPLGLRSNVKISSEPDAISDGSDVQNQEAYGKSVICSEAEVQVALNAAGSILKSGRPEAHEKGLANLGSTSEGVHSDVGAEEPVVSVCLTVGVEESADLFGDVDFASEQPGIKSKSEGEEDIEKAKEGGRGSAQKQVMQEPVFEDDNVHVNIEKLQSSDMANREVSDAELDGVINKDDTVVQLTPFDMGSAQKQMIQEPPFEDDKVCVNIEKLQSSDMANSEVSDPELAVKTNKDDTVVQLAACDELVGLSVEEDGTKDDIVAPHDSLAKQTELSMGKDISFGLSMDRHGVANDLVDTVKEPTQGLESEAVPSTSDVCEVPILGEYDGVGGNLPSHGEDHVPSGVEGEAAPDNANSEHESNPKGLTDDNVCDTYTSGTADESNVSRLSEPMTDQSSAHDIHETPSSASEGGFVEDNLVVAGKEPAPEPEFEVAPSTANDDHKMLSLGNADGIDGGFNATRESDGEDLVISGEDVGDDADNTYKEHESNSKPWINSDVSGTPVLGKEDYDNITRLFEPTLDPSSANDKVETPISDDDICSDIAMDKIGVADTGKERAHEHEFEPAPSADNDVLEMPSLGESDSANATLDPSSAKDIVETPISNDDICSDIAMDKIGVADTGKEPAQEHEFEPAPSADNDVPELPSLGESDSANATKGCENDSVPSSGNNMPSDGEDLVLGGGDGEDQSHNTNKEHESTLKRSTDDDDYNMTRQCEPTSDPSTSDIVETPFSVNDIFGDSDNAIYDKKSPLKPITDNDDGEEGVDNWPKELESGLEPSVTNYSPNVAVLVNEGDRSGQDGESEQLTRIDLCATGEQFIEGVGSEPDQNENMNVVTGDLIRSTVALDAREESLQDIDKDDYFGDIYGLGNAMGVTDTENDDWNVQKVTRTSETDESAFSKGSDSVSPDMNIEQLTEEAELTTESDHVLGEEKEQLGTAIKHNLDSGKSMEDCSSSAVERMDYGLVADLKVQETPTREESPVVDTLSDAPTSLKEDIRHKQEKTQKDTFLDWGNYGFRMDGFQKFVSANENDDLLAKTTEGDQVPDLRSSAGASFAIQESSSLAAADYVNPANKLEHSSRNVTDGKSEQDVHANMLGDDFDWSDSPLKSLFTTSATSRISHVKGGREHAADFANTSHYFDHHGNNDFNGDYTRGNATGEENEICGDPNFEHFPFEDDEVDGSNDWLGKNKNIEFKGDQYDLPNEAARPGDHHESSGLNVNSTESGVLGEKETQQKGSETGDDL